MIPKTMALGRIMDANGRRSELVRTETLLNTAITAVIAAILSGLIFPFRSLIPAISAPVGGILGIWPGTFNFTFLVTVGLTLVIRRRVRRQLYEKLPPEEAHMGGALPQNLFLRAASLAVIVTIIVAGATTALAWVSLQLGAVNTLWPFVAILVFYVLYFSLLSWLVTPVIIWRALRD